MSKLFFNRRGSWHIIFGTSPISKMWRSSNKCIILTNQTWKKRGMSQHSNGTRFNAYDKVTTKFQTFQNSVSAFSNLFLVSVEKRTSFNAGNFAAAVLWLFCMQDQLEERLPCSPLCVTVRVVGHYLLPGKELPPPCCFLKPPGMVRAADVKIYLSLFLFPCWSVSMTLHFIILPQ